MNIKIFFRKGVIAVVETADERANEPHMLNDPAAPQLEITGVPKAFDPSFPAHRAS
jgi:hypothetical protein